MSYRRVLPRDLFNEAKLLKCMGQLSLKIHDNDLVTRQYEIVLDWDTAYTPWFDIDRDDESNALYVNNLECTSAVGAIQLQSAYNSQAPYPLQFTLESGACGAVFNDEGNFDQEFIDALKEESNR